MSAALAPPLLRIGEDRLVLSLTWSGSPRTKKTSQRVVRIPAKKGTQGKGFTKVLPSKAFCEWQDASVPAIKAAMRRAGRATIIGVEVNCRALIYRDAKRGDACGFYQGIADLLQEAEVVENDALIVSWDGSRMLVDRENPRVELTLEEVR